MSPLVTLNFIPDHHLTKENKYWKGISKNMLIFKHVQNKIIELAVAKCLPIKSTYGIKIGINFNPGRIFLEG